MAANATHHEIFMLIEYVKSSLKRTRIFPIPFQFETFVVVFDANIFIYCVVRFDAVAFRPEFSKPITQGANVLRITSPLGHREVVAGFGEDHKERGGAQKFKCPRSCIGPVEPASTSGHGTDHA